MLKTKFQIKQTKTIAPESSYLKSIEITGNVAKVTMKGSPNVYTYFLTENQVKFLIRAGKDNQRIGSWFQKNIKNQLLSKTVPAG